MSGNKLDKARSLACHWMCSTIFSLNFRGVGLYPSQTSSPSGRDESTPAINLPIAIRVCFNCPDNSNKYLMYSRSNQKCCGLMTDAITYYAQHTQHRRSRQIEVTANQQLSQLGNSFFPTSQSSGCSP